MRVVWKLLALTLVFGLVAVLQADDKDKESKVLKGTITCAKCDLQLEKKCATVIKVKGKDDKDVVYYFDKDSHKKNHKEICTTPKEGTVTGKVSKEGDKNIVTVEKVQFKE
jgi:hypothetical protein